MKLLARDSTKWSLFPKNMLFMENKTRVFDAKGKIKWFRGRWTPSLSTTVVVLPKAFSPFPLLLERRPNARSRDDCAALESHDVASCVAERSVLKTP